MPFNSGSSKSVRWRKNLGLSISITCVELGDRLLRSNELVISLLVSLV
ncbi:hypothetical protein [Rubritalea tangerina]